MLVRAGRPREGGESGGGASERVAWCARRALFVVWARRLRGLCASLCNGTSGRCKFLWT
jgi:hypothetical protein